MPFFTGLGSTRANVIGVLVVVGAIIALIILNQHQEEDWAATATAWDAGEGKPAAVALLRNSTTSTTLAIPKTISANEISEDWCHCPINSRNGWGKIIRRYPSVYDLYGMYETKRVTGGIPANGCLAYQLDNTVDTLWVASTTDGLTLIYSPDGRTLTFCHLHPEKLVKGDSVVVWSDQSAYGFPS